MTTTPSTPSNDDNTADRDAYEVLADWVRVYWRYGIKIDSVDIFFNGHGENDDGTANTDYRCYSVLLHRQSVEPEFEIGDRSLFLYRVYTEPENAAQFYVWLTAEGVVESVNGLNNDEQAWAEEVITTLDACNPVDWIDDIDDYIAKLGMRWIKRVTKNTSIEG